MQASGRRQPVIIPGHRSRFRHGGHALSRHTEKQIVSHQR